MDTQVVRQQAIAAIEGEFGANRGMLRFLAWSMVVLLVLVHVIVTGAFIAGSASMSDFAGLNGICAPLTVGGLLFLRWTYRRMEKPLIEALRNNPPLVQGASPLEFRGRYGIHAGIEIRTQDGRLWKVKMHESLVPSVVSWLSRAGAQLAEAHLNYRHGAQGGRPGLVAWSTVERLPAICVHCAAASEKTTTVSLRLQGGSTMRLELPICGACARRKLRRAVIAATVMVGGIVGSAVVASQLYPPGNMRGLIIVGTTVVLSVGLLVAYRLVAMTPAIADHEGGSAGEELYVRFGCDAFDARARQQAA